jgi:hypothetical protein
MAFRGFIFVDGSVWTPIPVILTDDVPITTKSSFLTTENDNTAFIMNSMKLSFLKIHTCLQISNRRGLELPLSYTDVSSTDLLQIVLIIQIHPLAEDIKRSILLEGSPV